MTTSSPSQESESLDQQDRINPVVFYGSGLAILVFALWAMFFTEAAGTVIYAALAWISNSFGWFYFLAVVSYLVFVIAIACSRYGSIKLGRTIPNRNSISSPGRRCCSPPASVSI